MFKKKNKKENSIIVFLFSWNLITKKVEKFSLHCRQGKNVEGQLV